MKKALLGIALALAITPLTFAAQNPPANTTTAPKAKTHKKSHKKPMKKGTAAVKPATTGK